ncbi:bifunctional inhibitor/lipid-transfer protein/seed storage 2S albumin superfamily protein [Tasmannia lanceolata]|uniref:bifunctional inhibitor/lipid-transfer protein/seed storage 2S albumin superfamily protein n=1 Tax=Tasmannia lanceolata TaxID=3420 RepID=UPI0040645BCA
MASLLPPSALAISLLLIWIPFAFSSEASDIPNCGSQLLLLAPCAPFVQGSMNSPVKSCCENLVDLYTQQPKCLCVLLNDTTSFPINQTLALQLPSLCDLKVNPSTCPGLARLPQSQVILGSNSNSSTAESPTMALAPKLNMRSSGAKLMVQGAWVLAATSFGLMKAFS